MGRHRPADQVRFFRGNGNLSLCVRRLFPPRPEMPLTPGPGFRSHPRQAIRPFSSPRRLPLSDCPRKSPPPQCKSRRHPYAPEGAAHTSSSPTHTHVEKIPIPFSRRQLPLPNSPKRPKFQAPGLRATPKIDGTRRRLLSCANRQQASLSISTPGVRLSSRSFSHADRPRVAPL